MASPDGLTEVDGSVCGGTAGVDSAVVAIGSAVVVVAALVVGRTAGWVVVEGGVAAVVCATAVVVVATGTVVAAAKIVAAVRDCPVLTPLEVEHAANVIANTATKAVRRKVTSGSPFVQR